MKHVLETNWVSDDLKEKYDLRPIKGGFLVYSGVLLPKELRLYRSKDFGYARWVEDEMNAHVVSPDSLPLLTVNDSRSNFLVNTLVTSYEQSKPGHYIESGLSFDAIPAMLMSLSHIVQISEKVNREKILIVTDSSLMPAWRKYLKHFGGLLSTSRVLLLEYKNLGRLIETPAVARLARSKATKNRAINKNGIPTVDWDFVIFDNFQQTFGLHPTSLTYQMSVVSKTTEKYTMGESPFIMVHATDPVPSPINFLPFPQLLTQEAQDSTDRIWAAEELGKKFSMVMTDKGWCWLGSPLPRGSKLSPPTEEVMTKAKNKFARGYRSVLARTNGTVIPENTGMTYRTIPVDAKSGLKTRYVENWLEFRNIANSGQNFDEAFQHFIKEGNKVRQPGIINLLSALLGEDDQCIIVTDNVVGARAFDEALEKEQLHNRVQAMSLSELQEHSGKVSATVVMMESVYTFEKFFVVSNKVKCPLVLIPCLEGSLEDDHADKLFTADRIPCKIFVKRRAAQKLVPNRLS